MSTVYEDNGEFVMPPSRPMPVQSPELIRKILSGKKKRRYSLFGYAALGLVWFFSLYALLELVRVYFLCLPDLLASLEICANRLEGFLVSLILTRPRVLGRQSRRELC